MSRFCTSTFVRSIRRLPPLESVVLLLALAVLVAVAVAQERVKDAASALDSYSTYDPASGGYRALYELLAREGVPVDRFEQRPAFLGKDVDTLVWAEPLPFDTRQLAPARADIRALEDWVRSGGRLLYIGSDDAAAEAGILALPPTRIAASSRRRIFVAAPLVRAGIRRFKISAPRRYWIARHGVRVLIDDGRGAVAVTYALGRGRITALIDEPLFTNAALARGDNARLAVTLATPSRSGGRVSFDETVHGYVVPERWWRIIPRPFALSLLVAGLAIALAFTGAAVRLGPPLVPQEGADRTTADFIAALGSLFERGHAGRYALENATRSTACCMARALGVPASASYEQIAAGIEDHALRDAFRSLVAALRTAAPTERDFVRAMALAGRLRKEYAAHGRPRY